MRRREVHARLAQAPQDARGGAARRSCAPATRRRRRPPPPRATRPRRISAPLPDLLRLPRQHLPVADGGGGHAPPGRRPASTAGSTSRARAPAPGTSGSPPTAGRRPRPGRAGSSWRAARSSSAPRLRPLRPDPGDGPPRTPPTCGRRPGRRGAGQGAPPARLRPDGAAGELSCPTRTTAGRTASRRPGHGRARVRRPARAPARRPARRDVSADALAAARRRGARGAGDRGRGGLGRQHQPRARASTLSDGRRRLRQAPPRRAAGRVPRRGRRPRVAGRGRARCARPRCSPWPTTTTEGPRFLALEWIAPGRPDPTRRFGRGLAGAARARARRPSAGTATTSSAPCRSTTTPAGGWPEFYAERRLRPMARRAVDGGALPAGVPRRPRAPARAAARAGRARPSRRPACTATSGAATRCSAPRAARPSSTRPSTAATARSTWR